MTFKTVVLDKIPEGDIVLGETFKVSNVDSLPELKDDEVLLKPLYFSFDASQRVYIAGKRTYREAVKIGNPMDSLGLSEVVQSRSSKYSKGDLVSGMINWSEYLIVKSSELSPVPKVPGAPTSHYLGILGMTGFTAYVGLNKIAGGIKPGTKLLVSGAAGATGSVVAQLAKIYGAYVVAIAGTDEKCDMLKNEFGVDVALNYKSPTFKKDFLAANKDGIDVYFDNVGGEILEMAIDSANVHAKILMCGSISGYNTDKSTGIPNYFLITTKRLSLLGFLVSDNAQLFPDFIKEASGYLSSGKLKSKSTLIKGDITKAPEILQGLFKGLNTGKLVLEIDNATRSPL